MWWENERGTVVVLVAAALTFLLGLAALVVDGGGLLLARERLANAVDAAALAGVQFLPGDPSGAVQTALDYARLNGADPTRVAAEVEPDGRTLTVRASQPVPFFLARVLGLEKGEVKARAKARVGAPEAVFGVVPLGIPDQPLVFGRLYVLKVGGGAGQQGNFGALALGGRGAKVYESNLAQGYQGWLKIGDVVETEPGNMSGPTVCGIEARIRGHESCTWNRHDPGCPRLVIVPVYRPTALAGRDEVEIVGFAAFFIEKVAGRGNECCVTGYFLEHLTQAGRGMNGRDYGLRTAKLIE
ncbi:pilus assembly protein TadG-related protein [Ammonifex thiophilus]|uniref:Putative Flp pilus-assembly TadG-like N-terminal domain-containing protein n=1 Tax=Ammonifex thiophilus TaxID=444093 RepID=A0A3D8P6T0_9THEO|nr:pilus assembly protein TadG-related protein [Ammonifex thiophilus]RDV84064.1 hypothetical protein DXX99_04340 [Ammonifex thiophilus]